MATGGSPIIEGLENLSIGDGIDPAHIGARLNQWQTPVTVFEGCDAIWLNTIKKSEYVGDIDFGRREWARSRDAVDFVMKIVLDEIRKGAEKYKGLRIDSYIRQGSSRDGLKVIAPDEYDTVLEFHIEGLKTEPCPLLKQGRSVPGFCLFQILQKKEELEKKYQLLFKEKIFQSIGDTFYLSPKQLHERILTSLIDTAARAVEKNLLEKGGETTITRKKNPPAINITIHLNDAAHNALMKQGSLRNKMSGEIDLDIVPAMLLKKDTETEYEGLRLNCPVHAVCKWVEGDTVRMLDFIEEEKKTLVWHVNSAGYEKHTLDVARKLKSSKQQYILTALRIVKTYFVKAKKLAKERKESPPQLVSVLKSYNLKHVALYLIMYTCYLHDVQIDNAKVALIYFLSLLEVALEAKHLPHFYYSNSKIQKMYPNYPVLSGSLKYDHFRKAAPDALLQALKSLQQHLMKAVAVDTTGIKGNMKSVLAEFKAEITKGEYF